MSRSRRIAASASMPCRRAPLVCIMDMHRFELATNDDSALVKQDSLASVIIPKDGSYIVTIRESSYGGSGNSHYRLHIGTFPQPTAVCPSAGRAGEEGQV